MGLFNLFQTIVQTIVQIPIVQTILQNPVVQALGNVVQAIVQPIVNAVQNPAPSSPAPPPVSSASTPVPSVSANTIERQEQLEQVRKRRLNARAAQFNQSISNSGVQSPAFGYLRAASVDPNVRKLSQAIKTRPQTVQAVLATAPTLNSGLDKLFAKYYPEESESKGYWAHYRYDNLLQEEPLPITNAEEELYVENVGPTSVQGVWVYTENGPLFIAGSFITEDNDRKGNGWAEIINHGYEISSPEFSSYLALVRENRAVFLEVARTRVAELHAILDTLPPEVLEQIPQYVIDDIRNLTPEEYAVRMVSVPMTMNVSGWSQDLSGGDGPVVAVGSRAIPHILSIIDPNTPGPGALTWGDQQSAGFLELRFSQFEQLLQGGNINLGPYTIPINGFNTEIETTVLGMSSAGMLNNSTYFSSLCSENISNCYNIYSKEGSPSLLSPGLYITGSQAELVANLAGARYQTDMIRYLDAWQYSSTFDNAVPNEPESYWYMSSATAFAINQASAGLANYNVGFKPDRPYAEWGRRYRQSSMYFRAIFESWESTDSLIEVGDLELSNDN